MDEILKKLLENQVLSEDTRKAISEAFKKTLEEAKVEQEKAIRSDLAERFEKERKAIHGAVEQFVEQEMASHIKEFRVGIEEISLLKKSYADKIHSVKERAKGFVKKKLGVIEAVIEKVLRDELTELHESEKTSRRAYINTISEVRSQGETDRAAFKKKAAVVLENIVNVQIAGALEELKEDIQAARRADFGRELYEAFFTTFRRQFWNSNKEFRQVVESNKKLQKKMTVVTESTKKTVKLAEDRARAAEITKAKLVEGIQRNRKLGQLLGTLNGNARRKMKTLLEATKTADLDKTYKRFVTDILNETKKAPTKTNARIEKTVVELKTGGKLVEAADDDEIVNMRRLAGITR